VRTRGWRFSLFGKDRKGPPRLIVSFVLRSIVYVAKNEISKALNRCVISTLAGICAGFDSAKCFFNFCPFFRIATFPRTRCVQTNSAYGKGKKDTVNDRFLAFVHASVRLPSSLLTDIQMWMEIDYQTMILFYLCPWYAQTDLSQNYDRYGENAKMI